MLKLYHPFPGVGLLKIYKPTLLNESTISFFVMVDSRVLSFKLYHTGAWNEIHKEGVSQELVIFIREKIEELYGI